VLDASPVDIYLVDDDVQLKALNTRRLADFGGAEHSYGVRFGEILNCVNSKAAGCGRSKACKNCVIRGSVNDAIHSKQSFRKKTRFAYESDGTEKNAFLMITATPFAFNGKPEALLCVEDISDMIALQGLIPICASCKSVRDSSNYWHSLEAYLSDHSDGDLTHTFCDPCLEKLYPDEDDSDDDVVTKV